MDPSNRNEDGMDISKGTRSLEEALDLLFRSNFDADSKVCLSTLCKVIDNVLHKPGNDKVRSIRLANHAFSSKVASKKGGVEFLLACGFRRERSAPPLLSTSGPLRATAAENATDGEPCLILHPSDESTSHLVSARRLLMTRATNVLRMKAEELPPYRPPPPPPQIPTPPGTTTSIPIDGRNSMRSTSTSSSPMEFDVYRGHRYDAKSAAVGRNLGPEPDYVSTTEQQLQRLQRKREQLESEYHSRRVDRQWTATLPHQAAAAAVPSAANSATNAKGARGGAGDGRLLAGRMMRFEEERKRREDGGLTTKAMRDLAAMKKQRVYSHVSLLIKFPDGSGLSGRFLPKETVRDVVRAVRSDAFHHHHDDDNNDNDGDDDDSPSPYDFDLYVTPPRRLLHGSKTLEDEGLVPAARVFASWKGKHPPPPSAAASASASTPPFSPGCFLKPHLFTTTTTTTKTDTDANANATATSENGGGVAAFPTSQALVGDDDDDENNKDSKRSKGHSDDENDKNDPRGKNPMKRKEKDLLQRMMGGGRGGGGGGIGSGGPSTSRTNHNDNHNNNNNGNGNHGNHHGSNGGGGGGGGKGIPKWFKK